jgi:hypothetical protein
MQITAPSLLLAFAQGRFSVVVQNIMTPLSPHCSTHTAPSPHRRINAPSLLLAFAHTQSEAETPTESVGTPVLGRNSPVLCAGGVICPV